MKSFKQFLHTSHDVFRIYWQIAPRLTVGILITQLLSSLQGIVSIYIFSYFLDRIIQLLNSGGDVRKLLPFIVFYVGFEFFITQIELLGSYFRGALQNVDAAKLRLMQADLLINLGISQAEDPSLTNRSTRFGEVFFSMNQHLTLLIDLVALIFSIIVFGVSVYTFSPLITVIFITLFVTKYFVNGRFMNKIWRLGRDHTEERRNAWASISYLSEPANLKEVILSDGVKLLKKKFLKFINWYYSSYLKIRSKWLYFEFTQTILALQHYCWEFIC